jgi:WD40 repeat protein
MPKKPKKPKNMLGASNRPSSQDLGPPGIENDNPVFEMEEEQAKNTGLTKAQEVRHAKELHEQRALQEKKARGAQALQEAMRDRGTFETEQSAESAVHMTGSARESPTPPGPGEGGPKHARGAASAKIRVRMRETATMQTASGIPMLLPPADPQYLAYPDNRGNRLVLFDLADASPAASAGAVAIQLEHSPTAARVSADGSSLCLGCTGAGGGSLVVFDTADVLAAVATAAAQGEPAPAVQPQAQSSQPLGSRVAMVAFSHDGGRLFAMCAYGLVTVHDARSEGLPILRTLPFTGGAGSSNSTLAHAGRGDGYSGSTELLAAAGGGIMTSDAGTPCARQVRLWSVENDRETQMRTLDFNSIADAVALSVDAKQLAVGMQNGTVQVFSTATWEMVVDLPVSTDDGALGATEDPRVLSLQFSPDGTKLAAGRVGLDEFTVYDLSATATVVGRFYQPKSYAYNLAFFPSGDMLVTSGGVPGRFIVRMLQQPPNGADTLMCHMTAPSSSDDRSTPSSPVITSADVDDRSGVVALAAGSNLEVTARGKVLMSEDFGVAIEATTKMWSFLDHSGVRLQPGGALVACILGGGKAGVVALAVGSEEAFRFDTGGATVYDMAWSVDGSLLAFATGQGIRVLAAGQGGAEVCWLEQGTHVACCCFDSAGSWLAVGHQSGGVSIWDVSTWELAQTLAVDGVYLVCFSPNTGSWLGTSNTNGVSIWNVETWELAQTVVKDGLVSCVCFSPSSDRIAFWTDNTKEVVVQSLGSGEELHHFKDVNAASGLSFSPEGDFLLCCPHATIALDPHKARVLDLNAGANAEWAQYLPAMTLPVAGGVLGSRTLGWGQLSCGDDSTESNEDANSRPWVLYGAVGSQFVVADITTARHAIEDNAWSTERLIFISEQYPELVSSLARSAPHLVNIRDPETGDTILHHLARTRQTEMLHAWLDSGATVTPIKNAEGQTAVIVAIIMEQIDVAQLLWRALPRPVNLLAASLVLEELCMLPMTHPHLVKSFLEDVEPAIMQTVTTFRTALVRPAEVCGRPSISLVDMDTAEKLGDAAAPVSKKDAANSVPAAWAGKLPNDQPKTLVASKVVLLPNLLGDAKNSPFHEIVTYCDASVYNSKLLALIIQSKWEENIRFPRQLSIMLYGCAFAVGSAAMLASAAGDPISKDEAATFVDVLQGSMIFFEVVALGSEGWQLVRELLKSATCSVTDGACVF